jgi:hypothetical protein
MKKILLILFIAVTLFSSPKSILAKTISVPKCTDTDAKNIYTKGSTTTVFNNITSTLHDTCTPDGKKVNERYCLFGFAKVSTYTCTKGCVDGACATTATPTSVPTAKPTIGTTGPVFPTAKPTASVPKCTDTDAKNIYTKGSITTVVNGVSSTLSDVCSSDGKKVTERYCVSNTARFSTYTCTKGCVDGACRR